MICKIWNWMSNVIIRRFFPSVGPSYPANQILALDANNVSGTTWTDLTGNGNDFTLVGSPAFNASEGGGCLEFEGAGKYAELSTGQGVFDVQEYTIIIWFYYTTENSGYQNIWSYDFTSHATPFYSQHFRLRNDNVSFLYTRGVGFHSKAATAGSTPGGAWYQAAVTIKSGEQRIYVNGVDVSASGPNIITGTFVFYNQEVWIGKNNFSDTSEFKVGTVKFFNSFFSASELLTEFNNTKSRFGL
jgi:hypothetical protein